MIGPRVGRMPLGAFGSALMAALLFGVWCMPGFAQGTAFAPPAPPGPPHMELLPPGQGLPAQNLLPPAPRAAEVVPPGKVTQPLVADVRVVGVPQSRIRDVAQQVRTRADRPYDPLTVEDDVRRLTSTRRFIDVETRYQDLPDGRRIVIFQVVERPTMEHVRFVGNRIKSRVLLKKSGLKDGMAKDPYAVDEARRKLEEFYHEKGYSRAQITVMEGDKPEDRGVVFLINEGGKQRIWKTQFIGNTVASDGRLKTQIQSKPGILWIFQGQVSREEIDEDVNRLLSYYRSLGFFNARVGRRLDFNEGEKWLTLTFVIDEGPRYLVRNVTTVGNSVFADAALREGFSLVPGEHFDQRKMNRDVAGMQDAYGAHGYVFAAVEASPTFLEQRGTLDLVYHIEEGAQYHVGRIDPVIKGDNPHTRMSTVYNRISVRPGDIVDIREVRNSERRLKASGLYNIDPTQGEPPKIVFKQPGLDDSQLAEKPADGNFRGQSPDPPRGVTSHFRRRNARQGRPDGQPLPNGAPPPPQIPGPNAPPARRPGLKIRGQSPGSHAWGQAPPPKSGTPIQAQRPTVGATQAYNRPWLQPTAQQNTAPSQVYSAQQATAPAFGPQYGYPQTGAIAAPAYSPPGGFTGAAPYGAPPYNAAPTTVGPNGAAPFAAPAGPPPVYPLPPGGYANQPGAPVMGGPAVPGGTLYDPSASGYLSDVTPTTELPSVVQLEETQTGRFMFGVGVNSNAGVVGNIVIDERNFDITRFPRSWADIRDFTAFRGGGQQLRLEAVPGTQLQRYTITFREPYLFDSLVSFGVSGFLYTRRFFGWDEDRLGGRFSFGYQFPYRPDLSTTLSLGAQNVDIHNPRTPTPQQVTDVLGDNSLYSARLALTHDTRDNPFLATEGHMWELAYEQTFGDFNYPRGSLEVRQYYHTFERADGSGRHVISIGGQLAMSGDETPVFENFYAGGFSTIRGFDFRGASPRVFNVPVGGRMMLLASAEYMLPLTADDMLRAVVFCDAGTVEEDIELHGDNFRVAPGFGLRVNIPALGPAPLALDLAFPILHAGGDDIQNFSFFMGLQR